MKKWLLFLAVLLAAPPLFAQVIPPNQSISSASSGACTTGTCATWTLPNTNPSVTAQITGTMTSMTVTFEGTADGQTWFSVGATNLSSGITATTTTATGQYAIVNPGLVGFRVRCTTYVSGGVNVTLTRGTASAKSGVGGGGGGSSTATYVTETAEVSLPNSFPLASLSSGLLFNTTTTGVPSIYAGSSTCSGSAIASLNGSGVATCATAPNFTTSFSTGATATGVSTWTSTAGNNNSPLVSVVKPPPDQPTASLQAAGGACTAGTHVVVQTLITTAGTETLPSVPSAVVTCGAGGTDRIRVVSINPGAGYSGLNLYVSKAGTTTPLFRYLNQTNDMATRTTFMDVADGSLGSTQPPSTPEAAVNQFGWYQATSDAGDAAAKSGLRLFAAESGSGAPSDFLLTVCGTENNANCTGGGTLFLGNTTNNSSRNFAAGILGIGSTALAPNNRGVWSSTRLSSLTGAVVNWCSDTNAGTCDAGVARNAAGVVEANNGTAGTLRSFLGGFQAVSGSPVISTTAPTIASGGCTSPAVTHSNGSAAFLLTIGTSCTGVKTIVLTMPAAAHFWACDANNNTSDAQQAANTIASRATSTTAVTLTNYARTTGLTADFTASDTLLVKCSGE